MNKIVIKSDKLIISDVDKNIDFEYVMKSDEYPVSILNINVLKDTNLILELRDMTKLNMTIKISNNTNLYLEEMKTGIKGKIQTTYELNKEAICDLNYFNSTEGNREVLVVNLNGENAKFTSHFKTISILPEKYDMVISHNAKKTISDIHNHGVNIKDGSLIFDVTTSVENNITDCILNQANRIITYNDNDCDIKPNLLIGENDVEASHSALIGRFSDEELFYLMSRGITKDEALDLLTKGFILSDLKMDDYQDEINKIIDKYWR